MLTLIFQKNNDDLEQLCIKPYSAILMVTLLTSDHRISPKTLDALQRITKQGIPFTPISARSPLGIWPYAKLIENYNIIVAFSGALILDKNATPIYSVQLDPADIQAINQVLADHPCARCELLYL